MRFEDIPQFTRYGAYEIDVAWRSLKKTLADFAKDYELDLDPDFQRGHVWSRAKQIAYVEFVLRGGRSARTLLFNCPVFGKGSDDNRMVLVDGKQRLTAALRFLNNEIPAFGVRINDYEDELDWLGAQFRVYVNDLTTREEVLRWYLECNSGGVVHTRQELERVEALLAIERGEQSTPKLKKERGACSELTNALDFLLKEKT